MLPLRRVLAPLLLLGSVSTAEEDTHADVVSYERDGAWLVVRSASDRRNFLFRIPAAFEPVAEVKPPALVHLEAQTKTDRAVVRLQMSRLGSADLGRDMGEMVGSSYKSFQQGYEKPTEPPAPACGDGSLTTAPAACTATPRSLRRRRASASFTFPPSPACTASALWTATVGT